MSEMDQALAATDRLLPLAGVALEDNGFVTERALLDNGWLMLVAENHFFILGILEVGGSADVHKADEIGTLYLADKIAHAKAKQWDAYLVLLSTAIDTDTSLPERVSSIVYNTRYLRRVVRFGISPVLDATRAALSQIFALPGATVTGPIDPTQSLRSWLLQYGIDENDANDALSRWHIEDGENNE